MKLLAGQGEPVRALVRNPEKAAEIKGPKVEIVRGDLGDRGSLDAALRGADKLFLLTSASESAEIISEVLN